MILVLCEDADHSALWAAEALRMRGVALRLLTGAELATAKWEHRVGAAGADSELRFASGARLRGVGTRGVLNRLSALPAAWRRQYGGADREYALQEMHAFYLSWLHALPGAKVNAPTPQGLCGNWRHRSAWTALAVRAGLPVRPFQQSNADDPAASWQYEPAPATVHVVGPHVIGPDAIVGAHRAACVRLTEAAGVVLLGIDFARDKSGGWQMTGASVMPELTGGGEKLADALASVLAP